MSSKVKLVVWGVYIQVNADMVEYNGCLLLYIHYYSRKIHQMKKMMNMTMMNSLSYNKNGTGVGNVDWIGDVKYIFSMFLHSNLSYQSINVEHPRFTLLYCSRGRNCRNTSCLNFFTCKFQWPLHELGETCVNLCLITWV